MLTDKEVLEGTSDAEMIKRTHLWPHLLLPLKRVKDGTVETAVASCLIPENGAVIVYEGANIMSNIYEQSKRVVYDSAEAVVAAGWQVD